MTNSNHIDPGPYQRPKRVSPLVSWYLNGASDSSMYEITPAGTVKILKKNKAAE